MPWNWNAQQTGTTASVDSSKAAWPNYEMAYLAKRLGGTNPEDAQINRYRYGVIPDSFADSKIGDAARATYLDEAVKNYEQEADECLKQEFMSWLQGTHEENQIQKEYANLPGQPARRAIFHGKDPAGNPVAPGDKMQGWVPTWWQNNQLTHIDGVREMLQAKAAGAEQMEFELNTLAEFGPQNVEQAWKYFKHWVKGMPIKPEECLADEGPRYTCDDALRSGPVSMHNPDGRGGPGGPGGGGGRPPGGSKGAQVDAYGKAKAHKEFNKMVIQPAINTITVPGTLVSYDGVPNEEVPLPPAEQTRMKNALLQWASEANQRASLESKSQSGLTRLTDLEEVMRRWQDNAGRERHNTAVAYLSAQDDGGVKLFGRREALERGFRSLFGRPNQNRFNDVALELGREANNAQDLRIGFNNLRRNTAADMDTTQQQLTGAAGLLNLAAQGFVASIDDVLQTGRREEARAQMENIQDQAIQFLAQHTAEIDDLRREQLNDAAEGLLLELQEMGPIGPPPPPPPSPTTANTPRRSMDPPRRMTTPGTGVGDRVQGRDARPNQVYQPRLQVRGRTVRLTNR